MSLSSAIAIYFIIWWTVLFAVLPFGVRAQHEEGDVVPGSDEGAPARPYLLRKAFATTLLSALVFALVYGLLTQHWFGIDDIPFLPRYSGP